MPLFGTDGVRGMAGEGALSPERILALGRAAAQVLTDGERNPSSLLVGRDTRSSGPALQAALCAGFLSEGWDVTDVGILPTPAVARFVASGESTAGVVISASHNPSHDNGIKFFDSRGAKISAETEHRIESLWTDPRKGQASLEPSPRHRTPIVSTGNNSYRKLLCRSTLPVYES